MENENKNAAKNEQYENQIVRVCPNEYGIAYEIINERKIKIFQEHVERQEKTTVMDVVAAISPPLVRRLKEIADLLSMQA